MSDEASAKPDRVLLILATLPVLYFAIAILRHWIPSVGESALYFYYLFSMPVVLIVLLIMGVVAFFLRKPTMRRRLLILSITGFIAFGAALLADWLLQRGLPTGSFARRFDSARWKDPRSASYVKGDITPRQKMLGDVVNHVLPGRSRAEIDALLGPSLQTGYFVETHRDLIYMTGPERSFVSIDSEWLLIWLDDSGRFERYEIVTD